MKILAIHHVQITIPRGRDNEARAFYCGVLGMTEVEKPDSLKGRGGFWVRAGDRDLHIDVEDGVDRGATKAHVAYLVDDIDAYRRRLIECGAQMSESVPTPGWDRFEFRDPFENRVELIQSSK